MSKNQKVISQQQKDRVVAKAKEGETYLNEVAKIGMGQISTNSHPLHGGVVHWPAALLSTSFALDALELVRKTDIIPSGLEQYLPASPAARITSHYACAAGLLTAIPAVLTGLAELYGMYRGAAKEQGNKETIKKTAKGQQEKLALTITHALCNEVGVAIALSNWWSRHKNLTSYTLDNLHLWLSVAALGGTLVGAYLGGDLVYRLGVGVQRQGSALEKKEE